jgi:cellobiose phosphorylase
MKSHPLVDLFAPAPPAYLLSNGRYQSLLSAAGSGHSRYRDVALTRWHADAVEDSLGYFFYLRDAESGAFNSIGYQPVKRAGENYCAGCSGGCFSIEREDDGIRVRMDVAVSPDDDVEVRWLRFENRSGRVRRIEVTSYLEVVLNHPSRDSAHPAFSKLFVQTEWAAESETLIARRRPSSDQEQWPWLFHRLVAAQPLAWETDRLRFIGRGGSLERPAAIAPDGLSGTVGNVLDPILSLQTAVKIAPGDHKSLAFVTGVAGNLEAALELTRRYDSAPVAEAVLRNAADAERALCESIAMTEDEGKQFQLLAGAMLYGDPRLRKGFLRENRNGKARPAVGRLGIPEDRLLVLIRNEWESSVVQMLFKARGYWRAKGLETALAVLSCRPRDSTKRVAAEDPGLFVLDAGEFSEDEIEGLSWAAHSVVTDSLPAPWAFGRADPAEAFWPEISVDTRPDSAPETITPPEGEDLNFFNGLGGFSADGAEYVIRLVWRNSRLQRPPMPWINVVANDHCGFLVSDGGACCSWSRNSQANRLTAWSNDPVMDPHSEAFYIRDEESGRFWSPLPGPRPATCAYEIRHGFGYSASSSSHDGLDQSSTLFVPRDDPLRIVRLTLVNHSGRKRCLSLFSYCRLVLGTVVSQPMSIVSEFDRSTGALLAVNLRATEFTDGTAFCFSFLSSGVGRERFYSCDRRAFIGRNGSIRNPRALRPGANLDGAFGAGLDACFAEQWIVDLAPEETVECIFCLGEFTTRSELNRLAEKYRRAGAVERALEEIRDHWRGITGSLRVKTPRPAIDVMMNGWLIYQTLGCRLRARSAFYQSSGAYGFRDQLQDSAAMVYACPNLTRRQILLHAAAQFAEGDVLHWWHPEPMGYGIRTRMSDDRLWLPYVASLYVRTTGDYDMLDEPVPFLTGPSISEGADDAFFRPTPSHVTADVYEHCCRALDCSLTRGARDLPLIGTGDWNDGMNRVGRQGKGESVWLGFFLYDLLQAFLPICARRGDAARVARYQQYREDLSEALDRTGWDGEWYRRAYFDDGTPLGSHESAECRIDALPQAWAVISRAVAAEKAERAMDSVERLLLSEADGLIRLLTPPFVDAPRDPGYIKGYVAGIRENGGQYTHAACWVVMAFALLGRRDLAARLAEILSPVSHASAERIEDYKVEPYVVAADIYGEPPHVGRGGWTWYTGSAGWLYRVVLESILGFGVENGEALVLRPRIPDHWEEFEIQYRHPESGTRYYITVLNPSGRDSRVVSLELDGTPLPCEGTARIPLSSAGGIHHVKVVLGN